MQKEKYALFVQSGQMCKIEVIFSHWALVFVIYQFFLKYSPTKMSTVKKKKKSEHGLAIVFTELYYNLMWTYKGEKSSFRGRVFP